MVPYLCAYCNREPRDLRNMLSLTSCGFSTCTLLIPPEIRPHENWFIYHTHGLNHLSFLQHLNDATTNLHGSHCPLLIMHNYRCVGSFSHANEEYSMWFTWLKESTINKSLVKLFHRLQSPIKKIKNPMSHCNLRHCSPSNGWWIGLDERCRSPYWCLNINILISLSLSLSYMTHDRGKEVGPTPHPLRPNNIDITYSTNLDKW